MNLFKLVVSSQVNNVDFANIIREEAVLFLLDLPKGDDVTILAQKKKDGKGTFFYFERVVVFNVSKKINK